MRPKQERDAEEDDATWRYRNLERKLVLKETIYGPSHIAIVPTLFELACASMKKLENIDDSVPLLERALSIKDAHPSDASFPSTMWIVSYLCSCLLFSNGPETKITHVFDRFLTLQEEKGCNSFVPASKLERMCIMFHAQHRIEFQGRLLKILESGVHADESHDLLAHGSAEDRESTILKLS